VKGAVAGLSPPPLAGSTIGGGHVVVVTSQNTSVHIYHIHHPVFSVISVRLFLVLIRVN